MVDGELELVARRDGTPAAERCTESGALIVGVFRNGQWIVDASGTHLSPVTYNFGQAGDRPVTGNWAGIGEAIGVYRAGVWILDFDLNRAIGSADMVMAFGGPGYLPLVW